MTYLVIGFQKCLLWNIIFVRYRVIIQANNRKSARLWLLKSTLSELKTKLLGENKTKNKKVMGPDYDRGNITLIIIAWGGLAKSVCRGTFGAKAGVFFSGKVQISYVVRHTMNQRGQFWHLFLDLNDRDHLTLILFVDLVWLQVQYWFLIFIPQNTSPSITCQDKNKWWISSNFCIWCR